MSKSDNIDWSILLSCMRGTVRSAVLCKRKCYLDSFIMIALA